MQISDRSSGLGGVVLHTYTRKLVYIALSMRDAEYQTCLQQVLITFSLNVSYLVKIIRELLIRQFKAISNSYNVTVYAI